MRYRTERTATFQAASDDGLQFIVHLQTEFLEDDDGRVTETLRMWRTDAGDPVIQRPHDMFEVITPDRAIAVRRIG